MIIYLELNYVESRKKIREYAQLHNEKMRRKHPEIFRTKMLKSSHLRTAEMILEYFFNFLKLQAKAKPIQTQRFKINSVALAKSCGYNKRTAFNHVERLLEAGVLKEKFFMGSNTGYATEFNPDLLVSKHNFSYQQFLLAKYCELLETEEIPNKVLKKVSDISLSFSNAPSGLMKILPHIVTRTLLLELNINMVKKGIVDNYGNSADKTDIHQNSVINNDRLLQEPLQEHRMHSNVSKRKVLTPEQLAKRNRKVARRKAAHASFQFLEAVMYSDRKISDHDIDISLMHLEKYFEKAKTEKQLTQLFNEFIQRVMLVRQYLLRAPGRFIPNPRIWLDPAFKHGFVGTEYWLKQVDKKRAEKEEYYGNLKILANLYRQFLIQPTLENYLSGRQTLAKKKNPEYLKMFDNAVVNRVPQIAKVYEQMTTNLA